MGKSGEWVFAYGTGGAGTYQLTNISLAWHTQFGILEARWSNKPFPSEIAYKSPLLGGVDSDAVGRRGVYLKAQLIWGFGFDLD
ncbi:MAG: hypothetical protein ISR95_08930 [Candidatus Marinimicrobia bacterium]|nr:hypothetical protein [Candidatus Neomarinimicrobiota bacterium]